MTTNLRELTLDNHRRAERSRFIQRLIKREMTPYEYYVYMYNQLMAYYALETACNTRDIFKGMEELKRGSNISKDVSELESEYGFEAPELTKATDKYVKYIQSISCDKEKLLAHVYVRHMGDLSGGQIIKRLVPGSGLHYSFDGDVNELKEKIRSKLNDDMATEANKCFDMIYEFFTELEIKFGLVESADRSSK